MTEDGGATQPIAARQRRPGTRKPRTSRTQPQFAVLPTPWKAMLPAWSRHVNHPRYRSKRRLGAAVAACLREPLLNRRADRRKPESFARRCSNSIGGIGPTGDSRRTHSTSASLVRALTRGNHPPCQSSVIDEFSRGRYSSALRRASDQVLHGPRLLGRSASQDTRSRGPWSPCRWRYVCVSRRVSTRAWRRVP